MLQDYCEPFTLLIPVTAGDALGCAAVRYETGETFSAALCAVPGVPADPAGRTAARHTPVLLHPRELSLMPGDLIRRQADGATYRVLDCSDFMRTPRVSFIAFAQATLERLVTADA